MADFGDWAGGMFGAIGSAFNFIGSGMGLAATKRAGEMNLKLLLEQEDFLNLQYDRQGEQLDQQGELQQQSSDNMLKLVAIVGVLIIFGIVVYFVVKSKTK